MYKSRVIKRTLVVALSLIFLVAASANDREETICGFIKEPLLFWLWSAAAPDPDESRVANTKLIEPIEFHTTDERTLRGYRYISSDGDGNKVQPNGYILMALGNAMISDQIISSLKTFSEHGYDVYIYDYRGYGNSEGKRRINAIIEDYKELVSHLNKSYKRKLLYGVSLGGAVMLNVIGSGVEYDAAVIDSSPSLLSEHGCPERIDPIVNLPNDSSKLLVITGKKDPVLKETMTSKLRESASVKGAKVISGEDFSHPFMDQSTTIHNKRMSLVLGHLLGVGAGDNNE